MLEDFAPISVVSREKVLSRLKRIILTRTPCSAPCSLFQASTTFCMASPSGPGQSTMLTVVAPSAEEAPANIATTLAATARKPNRLLFKSFNSVPSLLPFCLFRGLDCSHVLAGSKAYNLFALGRPDHRQRQGERTQCNFMSRAHSNPPAEACMDPTRRSRRRNGG